MSEEWGADAFGADRADAHAGATYITQLDETADLPNSSRLSSIILSSFGSIAANRVLAGPVSGAAATPTFRALVAGDIPSTLNGTTFSGSILMADGSAGAPAIARSAQTNNGIYFGGSTVNVSVNGGLGVTFGVGFMGIQNGGQLEFSSNSAGGDVALVREAANVLSQRVGTNAQTFNIYNTRTDASNYERGQMFWSANELIFNTSKLGTGSSRAMSFRIDGTAGWKIPTTGHWTPLANNSYDIGSSSLMARHIYIAGTARINTIWDTTDSYVMWSFVGGDQIILGGANLLVRITNGLRIGNATTVVLQSTTNHVLEQRNSTNAQNFHVYNTYTDASNYERLIMGCISNVFHVYAVHSGTGAARTLKIGTGGGDIIFTTNNADRWGIGGSTGNLAAQANLNIWNGTSALATTATAGFLGVNSCAGPPTGVPASIPTGQTPLVFDSTNLRLYAYTGGSWRSVLLA